MAGDSRYSVAASSVAVCSNSNNGNASHPKDEHSLQQLIKQLV